MTDYLNNSNKTTLLFKKFQNRSQAAIDVGDGGTSFFNEQKDSLNNIYNTDIFIENIEKNLSDEYKLSSLDACGNIPGSIWKTSISDQDYSNSSFSIPNTNLIFYKEIYLNSVSGTNNAWWLIPPGSDQITDNNLLKDMIPFNFNSISLATFSPIVKYWDNTQWRTQSQNNVSGLNWLIDYASGILQFYQKDKILNSLNIDCNSSDEKKRPRISFIKYAGAKGLANFSTLQTEMIDVVGNVSTLQTEMETINTSIDITTKSITLVNNVDISGTLEVQDDASFNSNVDISGTLEVQGNATFRNNVDISGTLEVQGNATFRNNVDISGTLEVQGDASFNSNVDISGTLEVQGNASFNSNVDISGTLEVQGNATFSNVDISGTLEVQDDASFNSNVDNLRSSR
jgi:cytoskeletal protein CcmA (bactofilin family)